jgi:hypothetical protein
LLKRNDDDEPCCLLLELMGSQRQELGYDMDTGIEVGIEGTV